MKHNVEELSLSIENSSGSRFILPSCVFECNSLRSLTMNGASYDQHGIVFSSFAAGATSGLRSLHTLHLSFVEFLDSVILVRDTFSASLFPSLEKLTIK